jgi:hypothetical protein
LILKPTQSKNRTFKSINKAVELNCLAATIEDKESNLWHNRYNHLNFKSLCQLNSKGMVLLGMPKIVAPVDTCIACLIGKQFQITLQE